LIHRRDDTLMIVLISNYDILGLNDIKFKDYLIDNEFILLIR